MIICAATSRPGPLCELDILVLHKVDGLEEVITQAKSGEVQRVWDTYGPQKGRAIIPKWALIKVTINRRERVFSLIQDDFDNNGARFWPSFNFHPPLGGPITISLFAK
ncbi:hypothetical protein FIBSPDRAFT_884261 [Athelia psychrophila]|uniref:Uncharacterized protein n=1 Tax=Athelia psychrophila TaxID=1759441 RepID=A0A166T8U2_9AGAM|nr:hypothetical protein FIBSPDRAFT_884261 [Fibularhizoctonia sp. CBS 109695]